MKDTSRKTTVTLEDLLRVKRAEQPPAEFWSEFERGMRIKQLAAIVEPRPWWAPFIRVGARIARHQLPIGAAAILAITFVSLNEYRSVQSTSISEPAVAQSQSSGTARVSPVNTGASAPAMSVAVNDDDADDISAPSSGSSVAPTSAATPAAAMAANSAQSLVGTSSHVIPVNAELTPSAKLMAENLAAAQAADPELDRSLGRTMRRIEEPSARVEPLAQVSVPGESRRERLMGGHAWLASALVGNDSALRTDAPRHLSERRLSEDAVSRINVDGSSLTVKF